MTQRYNPNVASTLRGKKITSGTDRNGVVYDRNIKFQPGYEDLLTIVAGLQKQVKKINQCITLEGARDYAGKRKNWSAHEADITGPNGKPDGIKEVFVCDAQGNLKVINGVTLGKTDYPFRKAYRTAYKTKDDRRGHPYGQFKNELRQIHEGLNENGVPYYTRNPGVEIGKEFENLQPRITPRDFYKQQLFQAVYDSFKDGLKAQGLAPMLMAQIYNKALARGFYHHIKYPVLSQILGGVDPDDLPEKTVNKALKSKAYNTRCEDLMLSIINNPNEFSAVQREIQRIIGETIDEAIGNPNRTPNSSPKRNTGRQLEFTPPDDKVEDAGVNQY